MREHGVTDWTESDDDSPDSDEAMDCDLSQNASETRTFVRRAAPAESMRTLKKESSAGTSLTYASSKRTIGSNDCTESSSVWSSMLSECEEWHDDDPELDIDVEPKLSLINATGKVIYCLIYELHHVFQTVKSHPYIPICTLVVLAILTTIGVLIANVVCHSVAQEKEFIAMSEALITGSWFADQFSTALLPLYSLQQAVTHSEYFKHLASQIDHNGAKQSGPVSVRGYKFKNVTGICDNASAIEEFREIVTSIQDNFALDGIVLQYRLVPDNVFCLFEPLVDSDFGAGKIIDSAPLIGLDLVKRPDWDNILESTYAAENPITISGPKQFYQNKAMLTEEMFCAHLAVNIPGNRMTVGNRSFISWGFVMSLIDWAQLKQNFRLFDRYKKQGIEFHLYRNDTVLGTDGTDDVQMVTIARSDNWLALTPGNFVEVPVSTPNGEWINRVGYASGFAPHWHGPVVCMVVFLAFVLSMMFMMILIGRQLHRQLLFRVMPKSAVQKLHRGQTVIERFNLVTIFFSDIVDFTSMAGGMKPIQVMRMLNELYTAFDSIVEKYGVYKVETIGDAYMVVGGAPNRIPASEAAEKVALFALEATEFVEKFKTSMGDQISIRVGIASGPAVAGVVGKTMPRYCFFGDTVNSASRMESSSRAMRIQCSDLTFRLLNDAPNYVFVTEERRENGTIGVEVKGKGYMNTWWINGATKTKHLKVRDADFERAIRLDNYPTLPGGDVQLEMIPGSFSSYASSRCNDIENQPSQLSSDHVSVGTYIQVEAISGQAWSKLGEDEGHLVAATADCDTMVDRIASMLEIKLVDVVCARNQTPLDDVTKRELKAYVAHIESLYNHVEYHSFEHASHVTISMNKLVNTDFEQIPCLQDRSKIDRGLCENPFISFMMVYSALVHDVGHSGKSNKILQDQNEEFIQNAPSPFAEQFSINMAVQALGRAEFSNLKTVIIPTTEDKIEFAKILFCAILCTDVACQDRLAAVKERFDAVNKQCTIDENDSLPNASEKNHQRLCPLTPHLKDIYRVLSLTDEDLTKNQDRFITTKACLRQYVAIEHLMQVADVAHCMQGWGNFIKWNYRLYKEFMDCYGKHLIPEPSQTWSAGQIAFINNYILPLAERTETCCGLASNLNLVQLAKENRQRWENEGQFITAIFISSVKKGENEDKVLQKCFANEIKSN